MNKEARIRDLTNISEQYDSFREHWDKVDKMVDSLQDIIAEALDEEDLPEVADLAQEIDELLEFIDRAGRDSIDGNLLIDRVLKIRLLQQIVSR